MSRRRLAVTLAVVAGLCLTATVALAVTTYAGDDDPPAATRDRPLVVTDPASGATFEVPAHGWRVRERRERITYGSASVSGPAVLAEGYCASRPDDSFRAVAGFTAQPFATWVEGVRGQRPAWSTGVTRQRVRLDDGTAVVLASTSLLLAPDACSSGAVDVVMAAAGEVRVVVVADTGDEPGALPHDDLEDIARSLRLR